MTMKIGEVAALAGVPTATVRYYERRGLLAKAPRTGAGYRTYGLDTATRLRFIRRAQDLGFSLEEIQELLGLRVDAPSACSAVEVQVRAKMTDVERKIRELGRMREILESLAESCRAHAPTAECPILESLVQEEPDV